MKKRRSLRDRLLLLGRLYADRLDDILLPFLATVTLIE